MESAVHDLKLKFIIINLEATGEGLIRLGIYHLNKNEFFTQFIKEYGVSEIAEKILVGIDSPYYFIFPLIELLAGNTLDYLADSLGYNPKDTERIKRANWLGVKAIGYVTVGVAGTAVGGPPGALGAVAIKAVTDGISFLCSYLF